jgi:ATP-binding cassette subfamily B protein
MPLVTASVIDILSQNPPDAVPRLAPIFIVAGVVILQNVPTNILFFRYLSTTARNLEMTLRTAVCRRLQHLSIGFYTRSSTGALQTKLVRDVEQIQQLFMAVFEVFLSMIILIGAALMATAIRAPRFLLFYVAVVPVAVVVVYALRKRVQQGNQAFRQQVETMSSRLAEMTQLIPITRAHGEENHELEMVEGRLAQVRSAGLRLDSTNALFNASAWVTIQIFNILVLGITSWLFLSRWITISLGDVVLLTGYFSSLTGSVLGMINLVPQILRGLESIYSLGEIMECPDLEQNEGKTVVKNVEGRVAFDHIHFAYPGTDEDTVDDFSLDVRTGETVAFVGSSGAGKTTILNLAIGFLRPTSGRILLDDRDAQNLDMRTYRRFIAVVPQETVLFDGSVRDNVTYGHRQLSDTAVLAALRDANALDFVLALPDGLETLVGERGARLSGGQKQRLAIARALIRDPRLLILDEATSALDPVSEKEIQEALERLMHGRTTLVVAHRLSTIRGADRIVVMANGQIVETGTHAGLLEQRGAYFHLQQSQL